MRTHDSEQEFDGALEGVLSQLGVTGLVVRMADRDRRARCESAPVGRASGEPRGSLEVIPLGSEPIRGSAWTLLCDLLEMMIPVAGTGEMRGDRGEVRIDGTSPAVERLRQEVQLHAGPGYAVLVHGETGSGKEVVAKELHRLSGRKGELVSVNIAAIPINLLEAELFGSVKGAFTGAERSRGGLVAAADGGTLFLDEVGDLDLALQVKLLRFLESGEVRPVGSDRTKLMDVRVVCATHRNLDRLVREGRFRGDLFFRIAVAKIRVPPLRERVEDIRGSAVDFRAGIVASTRAAGVEMECCSRAVVAQSPVAGECPGTQAHRRGRHGARGRGDDSTGAPSSDRAADGAAWNLGEHGGRFQATLPERGPDPPSRKSKRRRQRTRNLPAGAALSDQEARSRRLDSGWPRSSRGRWAQGQAGWQGAASPRFFVPIPLVSPAICCVRRCTAPSSAFSPRVLDVPSSTPPRHSDRKPSWAQYLADLATKPGEKCGLSPRQKRCGP